MTEPQSEGVQKSQKACTLALLATLFLNASLEFATGKTGNTKDRMGQDVRVAFTGDGRWQREGSFKFVLPKLQPKSLGIRSLELDTLQAILTVAEIAIGDASGKTKTKTPPSNKQPVGIQWRMRSCSLQMRRRKRKATGRLQPTILGLVPCQFAGV